MPLDFWTLRLWIFFKYFPSTFFNFLKSIQFQKLKNTCTVYSNRYAQRRRQNTCTVYFYQQRASAGLKIPAPFTSTSYAQRRHQNTRTDYFYQQRATIPTTSNTSQYPKPHPTHNQIPINKKPPPFPAASPECNSGRAGKEGGFRRERNHASKVAVSLPPKARV